MGEQGKFDPILLDLPEQLTTDRLTLRPPRAGDGARINAAVVESARELAQWMPWARPIPSPRDTELWVRNSAVKFLARQDLNFSLYLKGTDTFVGSCGMPRLNWDVPTFEIGYWLRTSQCGKGYMHEAVEAVTRFAIEHLKARRIEIRCDDHNVRSARVAERAGFTLEGTLRSDARSGGDPTKLRDTRVYAFIPPTSET